MYYIYAVAAFTHMTYLAALHHGQIPQAISLLKISNKHILIVGKRPEDAKNLALRS